MRDSPCPSSPFFGAIYCTTTAAAIFTRPLSLRREWHGVDSGDYKLEKVTIFVLESRKTETLNEKLEGGEGPKGAILRRKRHEKLKIDVI